MDRSDFDSAQIPGWVGLRGRFRSQTHLDGQRSPSHGSQHDPFVMAGAPGSEVAPEDDGRYAQPEGSRWAPDLS